ncbi:DUF1858 domain-containing protein [Acetohalobium arabaticum]|uniref:DUF1858 domain-containing protein n=1 Tax=Acetohalobium arabaticum (strain ATCC 49924 / DSM 5501 / Z-7288) TaxID=574087 RepID=D9QQZ2_ACEAZ|nr:DUF1858 domain-containing protein [Acetohalobium arabaticum]ADL12933.1 Domain of unknown function DUF1858 [Acetohalobium arabaticum DSM 5501]
MKIKKDMYVLDVLKEYPEVKKVLSDYGLSCSGCLGVDSAQIEEIAFNHEIDLESLLADLNKAVEKMEEKEE